MTSYGASVAAHAESGRARPAVRGIVTLLAACALAGLALAPLAGWLWVRLANPPQVMLYSDGGIYLGEQALNQQAGVTLWFFMLGAAFGVVAGLVVASFAARFGWLSVVGVLVLCVLGSLGSRYVGVHVFAADPHAEAAHASTGDLIRLGVQVDTWVAYLGWPIGGVLGALCAIAGWSRRAMSPAWPTLNRPATPPTDPMTRYDDGGSRPTTGDTGPG